MITRGLGGLLGYENMGHRVLINNEVIIAKHVDIVKENLIGFKDNDGEYGNGDGERNNRVGTTSCKLPSEKEITDGENENKGKNEQELVLRRSEGERKKPDRYGETATFSNYIYVNFVSAHTTPIYEKIKNKSWKLVDRPDLCLPDLD